MVYLLDTLQNQLQQAYHLAGEVGASVNQRMTNGIHTAKVYIAQTNQAVKQGCKKTIEKTIDFVTRNQTNIFFVGCCCATAYFAPHLFFPVLIATIIVKVELSRHLKHYAKEYLKDDHNPYLLNPLRGPNYITTLDVTMGAIAAVDAIALGTVFLANSWAVSLIPALGGLAAGSCIAKWGMDLAHF
jgi:ElaB/YqjD/DUF883 family membrane-anchored ribosome-binding protein